MPDQTNPNEAATLAAILALGMESPTGDGVPVNNYSRLLPDVTVAAHDHVPQISGYDITGRLGEGGMGVVWRAVQHSTRRSVALKIMSAGRFGSERARQRFDREVELAARLEHPFIARVYDSGSSGGGVHYYAMELVEGVQLDRYAFDNALDVRAMLLLMRDACSAVHYAHARGVVHRDLKPSNVIVSSDGRPHIVDFGMAKALEGARVPGASLTQEGQFIGTPAFMAPEQAMGRQDSIDERCDVYGLGATLYVLLTRDTPHDMTGPPHEILRRLATQPVRPPRRRGAPFHESLELLLLKALARDPADRHPSSAALAADIELCLQTPTLLSAASSAREEASMRPDPGSSSINLPQLLDVLEALRRGDFAARMRVPESLGRPAMIARTINATMEMLESFKAEQLRLMREIGTKGILGGTMEVYSATGGWIELLDAVNRMSIGLTSELRLTSQATAAIARGKPPKRLLPNLIAGEIAALQRHVNAVATRAASSTRAKPKRIGRRAGKRASARTPKRDR